MLDTTEKREQEKKQQKKDKKKRAAIRKLAEKEQITVEEMEERLENDRIE
jgi:hypothetical protein